MSVGQFFFFVFWVGANSPNNGANVGAGVLICFQGEPKLESSKNFPGAQLGPRQAHHES